MLLRKKNIHQVNFYPYKISQKNQMKHISPALHLYRLLRIILSVHFYDQFAGKNNVLGWGSKWNSIPVKQVPLFPICLKKNEKQNRLQWGSLNMTGKNIYPYMKESTPIDKKV